MGLSTLLLDAGGVLAHPNWERVSAALAAEGVAIDPAALAFAELRAKRDLDVPIAATTDEDRWAPYVARVFARADLAPSAATHAAIETLRAYHAAHNLWESVPAEVEPALGRFRALGLRMVVVSNANGTVEAALRRLGLASYFDAIVDSTVVGVEKPDPRIFRLALARVGAQAIGAVHVGDFYHVDVAGARAAGVGAVLLDAADLYADHQCRRVRSLTELADLLETDRL